MSEGWERKREVGREGGDSHALDAVTTQSSLDEPSWCRQNTHTHAHILTLELRSTLTELFSNIQFILFVLPKIRNFSLYSQKHGMHEIRRTTTTETWEAGASRSMTSKCCTAWGVTTMCLVRFETDRALFTLTSTIEKWLSEPTISIINILSKCNRGW